VKNPIAISPYYTNQMAEPHEDPKYTRDRIQDYEPIAIEDVVSATPGDLLIAGLDEAHRTEVSRRNVVVGVTPAQVHPAFAGVVTVSPGTNLDLTYGKKRDRGGAWRKRFRIRS
jgi:polygalacturonase